MTAGLEVTTKVYPSSIIPDKKELYAINLNKKNYRPNNFMSENGGFVGTKRLGSVGHTGIDEDDE
jgi:hypothetical protein